MSTSLGDSSHKPDAKSPCMPLQVTSHWVRLFGPAEADGYEIDDPFDETYFDAATAIAAGETPYSYSIAKGGRIFLFGAHSGTFEIWPLFTDDAAEATIQIFSFTLMQGNVIPVDTDIRSRYANGGLGLQHPNADVSQLCLGPADNMTRDASGNPHTLTVTAEDDGTVQLATHTDGTVWVDMEDGIPYRHSNINRWECAGKGAAMIWVPEITAGELLILGRTY